AGLGPGRHGIHRHPVVADLAQQLEDRVADRLVPVRPGRRRLGAGLGALAGRRVDSHVRGRLHVDVHHRVSSNRYGELAEIRNATVRIHTILSHEVYGTVSYTLTSVTIATLPEQPPWAAVLPGSVDDPTVAPAATRDCRPV